MRITFIICAELYLFLLCSNMDSRTGSCDGQSTEAFAPDTRTDCPGCYAETYREFSDEMVSLKISLQKVRIDMAKLRQDSTSEIAILESDIASLTSQIRNMNGSVVVQGPPGYTGPTGITGPVGLTGATGFSGHSGASGYRGLTGVTGSYGYPGKTGALGRSGATGSTGSTGAPGLIGLSGATGATGATGVKGPSGARRRRAYIGIPMDEEIMDFESNRIQIFLSQSREKESLDDKVLAITNDFNNFNHNVLQHQRSVCRAACVSNFSRTFQSLMDVMRTQLETRLDLVQTLSQYRTIASNLFSRLTLEYNNIFANQSIDVERFRGAVGMVGPWGRTGFTGVLGYTGPVGSTGFGGQTGSTGPVGFTGSTGSTGSYGRTGVHGYTGSTGLIGPSGYTGSTGPQGYTGPPGVP